MARASATRGSRGPGWSELAWTGRAARVAVVAVLGVGLTGQARPAPSAAPRDDTAGGKTHASPGTGDGVAPAPTRGTIPDDTAAVRHLLSRATYGVRPADLERALGMGPGAWLEEQLHPERLDDTALETRLAVYPAAALDATALYERYPPSQALARLRNRDAAGDAPGAASGPPDSLPATPDALRALHRDAAALPPGRMLFDLVGAKLERAVFSERQLEEVMTDFWLNHFNVFWAKGADRWLVADYEREAIRPYVFGRFEDMLVATAGHPAMLFYLDNQQNVAPDSLRTRDPRAERFRSLPPALRRRALERRGLRDAQIDRVETALQDGSARQRGINENYARELLELHTLGVDGGYTQEDVIEVARVFTGWSATLPRRPALAGGAGRASGGALRRRAPGDVMRGAAAGDDDAGAFAFRPAWHDPTDKTVLGVPIAGRKGPAGMDEGREVLSLLARHPSTARHVATQLAVAFVSDDPPEALVDELARTFLDTDGDLRAVTRALFTSEYFYDPSLYGAKLKTPFELLASAARTTGARVGPARDWFETLRDMGELPYMSQPPTGYPDEAEAWGSSGALLQRVNFALALANGEIRGLRVAPDAVPAPVRAARTDEALAAAVSGWVLPGVDPEALEATIAGELAAKPELGARERTALALGLALAAPDFQAR